MKEKYEIKAIDLDDFELHYWKDNKEIVKPFKRTIELATKLQGIDANARFKMYEYLTKNGKTKEDLIIERKDEKGNIVVDETNYREFEKNFLLQAQYEAAEEVYKILFNMSLVELITELNLNENEAFLFGNKIRTIINNGAEEDKIPSETKNESVPPKTSETE